jgi:hypothetical protein
MQLSGSWVAAYSYPYIQEVKKRPTIFKIDGWLF